MNIKSVGEARDYIKDLLGNGDAATKFGDEFVKRRKGLVVTSNVPIKSSTSADKKSKKKVTANHLLGFTVINPNQGELESLEE